MDIRGRNLPAHMSFVTTVSVACPRPLVNLHSAVSHERDTSSNSHVVSAVSPGCDMCTVSFIRPALAGEIADAAGDWRIRGAGLSFAVYVPCAPTYLLSNTDGIPMLLADGATLSCVLFRPTLFLLGSRSNKPLVKDSATCWRQTRPLSHGCLRQREVTRCFWCGRAGDTRPSSFCLVRSPIGFVPCTHVILINVVALVGGR